MGRSRRLATRDQRRALRAMYRTCGFPGCGVRFEDCRIHHVTWWEHFGTTNLDNLLPLCERHHHDVHDGGWTLTMKPDRTITLRRPDGTLHHDGVTTSVTKPAPPPDHDHDHDGGDDEPPPGESEIPLHLRRAARRNRPQPTDGAARATETTSHHDTPPTADNVARTPPDNEPRPGESEIPPHLRRAARRTQPQSATMTPRRHLTRHQPRPPKLGHGSSRPA